MSRTTKGLTRGLKSKSPLAVTALVPSLSAEQVASWLTTRVRHIYRLIRRKHHPLPAHKIGHYWRFDRDEVLAWWEEEKGGRSDESTR